MKLHFLLLATVLLFITQISVAGQLSLEKSFSAETTTHAEEEKKKGDKGDKEEEPDCD